MLLKLPWSQERMFWTFENHIFQIFTNFWATKLKLLKKVIPGKVRKSVKNCLNPKLVIESFLKIGFEDTLRSKANVLNLWI